MFEKLFYNEQITGRNDSPEAILVQGQKISAVGSRKYCLNKAGSEFQNIDCEGKTIVPGFSDSHCHLVETGEALLQPELKGRSMADLLIIIKTACSRDSMDYPFIVMGINDYQFNELRRQKRNFITSNKGLLIFHSSGHCAIADVNASERLHYSSTGAGPVVIDEPYENPQILMILQQRKHQDIHLERSIRKGVECYLSYGITSLQDNTWDPEVFRYISRMIRGIDITSWMKGDNTLSTLSLGEGINLPDESTLYNITKGNPLRLSAFMQISPGTYIDQKPLTLL